MGEKEASQQSRCRAHIHQEMVLGHHDLGSSQPFDLHRAAPRQWRLSIQMKNTRFWKGPPGLWWATGVGPAPLDSCMAFKSPGRGLGIVLLKSSRPGVRSRGKQDLGVPSTSDETVASLSPDALWPRVPWWHLEDTWLVEPPSPAVGGGAAPGLPSSLTFASVQPSCGM